MNSRLAGRLRQWAATLCLCAGLLTAPAALAQTVPGHIALVISGDGANGSAPDVPAGVDAAEAALGPSGLGFTVIPYRGATIRDLYRAEGALEGQLQGAKVLVIYYAGYGVRVGDTNYLMPVGANPLSAADIKRDGYDLDALVHIARAKGVEVVLLLDACRNKADWYTLGGTLCLTGEGLNLDHVYVLSAKSSPVTADAVPSPFTAGLVAQLKRGVTISNVAGALRQALGARAAVDLPIPRDQDPMLSPAAAAPPGPPPPQPQPQPLPPPVQPQPEPQPPPPQGDSAAVHPPQPDTLQILGEAKDRLREADSLYDGGNPTGARARVAGLRSKLDRVNQSDAEQSILHLNYLRLSMIEGDTAGVSTALQTLKQKWPKGDDNVSVARRNFYEGSWALMQGRWSEAATLLEATESAFAQSNPLYFENTAKARARLGEAYRQLGRDADARAQFALSSQAFRDVDNAAANMGQALIALKAGSAEEARVYASNAVRYRESTPTRAGLGPAYAAQGQAIFAVKQQATEAEAEAWDYVDKSAAADPNSPELAAFIASLSGHRRMAAPIFSEMRPAVHEFDRGIEGRAQACYLLPEERNAYLDGINAELGELNAFNKRILQYLSDLTDLDERYKAHGYTAFYAPINREHLDWEARSNAIVARSNALLEWFALIRNGTPACARNVLPTPFIAPPSYNPDGVAATGSPQARVAMAQPAPAPYRPAVVPPPAPVGPITTAPPPAPASSPRPVEAAPAPVKPVPAAPQPTPVRPQPEPPVLTQAQAPPPAPSKPAPSPPASPPAPRQVTQPPATQATVTPSRQTVPPPPTTASHPRPTPAPLTPAPVPASAPVATPPVTALVAPPSAPEGPRMSATTQPSPPATTVPAGKGKGAKPPPAPPPEAPLAKAERLLAAGSVDAAFSEYDRLGRAEPGSPVFEAGRLTAAGLIKLRNRDVAGAVTDLEAARKLKPPPEALEALGRIYSANGSKGPAITAFSQAIAMRPHYFQALHGRAEAYRARGTPRGYDDLKLAIADYAEALALRSDFAEGQFGLGSAQFQSGDYRGALGSFSKALLERPIYPEATYAHARTQYELGAYQEALKDLGDLGDSFDGYALSCSRGIAYNSLGNEANAADDQQRSIEAFHNAELQFRAAIKARPTDPEATRLMQWSSNMTLPGLIGRTFRAGKKGFGGRFAKKEPGYVSPSATFDYDNACKL